MVASGKTLVCPQSGYWAALHQRLTKAADGNSNIPSPPVPLILAGWAYTNDLEKQSRWRETLIWAERYGLSEMLQDIPDEQMYSVRKLSSYAIGPLGGPMYLAWNSDPRPEVGRAERAAAIHVLKSEWSTIAGVALADITKPLRMTGRKGRRLVVAASSSFAPPWGSWTGLSREEKKRRSFATLLAAVNRAIAPLEIDHIDFIAE
ncbi:MAG TPA: hypothetical protein VHX61_07160 [Rhizomicrobium sp.]|jgi:hypothetical protein|nr:hypothetical protein [Rhizomicrobium sp.]